jgi:cell division initiation protein
MARITPLDIIQKEFSQVRKGCDPDEVSVFLDEVRDALEESLKDNRRLGETVRHREAEIERMRGNEGEIKDTLILAKKLSAELESGARREADLVLGEARIEAQAILSASHDEHRELLQEVHRLKGLRARLRAEIRAVLDAHGSLLQQLDARSSD